MLSRVPSKRAAREAVLRGRTVCWEEVDAWRVGDATLRVGERFRLGERGGSGVFVVPRVLSHEGWDCVALLFDAWSVDCEGVVGVSFGFKGELFGVNGLTVAGELSRMEPGRRKGDWRGLLKESGEGLYGVGVVDCSY